MKKDFEGSRLFSVIDELPKPSLLGSIAPRLTWLLVNRFPTLGTTPEQIRLCRAEFDALFTATQLPYEKDCKGLRNMLVAFISRISTRKPYRRSLAEEASHSGDRSSSERLIPSFSGMDSKESVALGNPERGICDEYRTR